MSACGEKYPLRKTAKARGCTMPVQCRWTTVVTATSSFCAWLHGAEDYMLSSGARGCTVHVLALSLIVGTLFCLVLWDLAQDQLDFCLGFGTEALPGGELHQSMVRRCRLPCA